MTEPRKCPEPGCTKMLVNVSLVEPPVYLCPSTPQEHELAALRARNAELGAENEAMLMDAAVGSAIIAAWRGESVSDFMQSFPDVMDAMWGYAQMKELRRG